MHGIEKIQSQAIDTAARLRAAADLFEQAAKLLGDDGARQRDPDRAGAEVPRRGAGRPKKAQAKTPKQTRSTDESGARGFAPTASSRTPAEHLPNLKPKRKPCAEAVRAALAADPSRSNSAIAAECGCSESNVRYIRRKMPYEEDDSEKKDLA